MWSDAIIVTSNNYNFKNKLLGGKICGYDFAAMYAGYATEERNHYLSSDYINLLPASIDGPNPPPNNQPCYILSLHSSNQIAYRTYSFTNDVIIPLKTKGPKLLNVQSYAQAGEATQRDTTQTLETGSNRLLYRMAYRNFNNDHGSLVVTHSATMAGGNGIGVKWYELRHGSSGGVLSIFQEGFISPDSTSRFMVSRC